MSRPIHIKAVPNQQPDIGLYVLALIALARQLQEGEQAAEPSQLEPKGPTNSRPGGLR